MRDRVPRAIRRRMNAYPLFCRKVWSACLRIPRGTVITYGELARRIGNPGAARAVGTALSRNPFAPIVPCHRVIRSDGSLGRYSGPGGTRTKQRLLRNEGVRIP